MKDCKNILSVIFWSILMLSFIGCGKTTANDLLEGASTNDSALSLCMYDGEKVSYSNIYDTDTVQTILDKLSQVQATEAKNWSLNDITIPIYGVETSREDGTSLLAAWSNGYWITQDGTVYLFDFDFAELEQDYSWEDQRETTSISFFPCARFLTSDKNGWSSALLTPAAEINSPDGVSMTLESLEDNSITVNFSNRSGTEWTYSEYFYIQVLLDDVWYEVPTVEDWVVNDIAYFLPDGSEQNQTFNLTCYGDLPVGTYRLVTEDLSVEFNI